MVDFLIAGAVAVLMLAICCCYLKFDAIKKEKSLKYIFPKDVRQLIFGAVMIISTVLVLLTLFKVYDSSLLFAVKRIILFISLWPIAFIDYRKHIIPNKVLAFLLIIRIIIAVVEMMYDFKSAKIEILSSLIASVSITILLCVMRLIVKEGIGFGDIKLFAIISLFLGLKGCIPSIFMSFVISFFVSIFMLISKRKGKKDQIAFAPSILMGTLLSIIFFEA